MNTKIGRVILVLYLLLSVASCDTAETKMQRKYLHFSNGRELVEHLDQLFVQLAQIDPAPSESKPLLTSVNEQIRKTIESIKNQRLLAEVAESYIYKAHEFGFILSEDRRLAVFSWDAMGEVGTNKLKNIALYTKGHKIIPSSLYGEPIIYHEAHTIQDSKSKHSYVIHGKGKTQEGHDFYRLDALNITPNGLSEAPIFPDRQYSMISAHPIDADARLSADFSIEKDGSLILKPEFWYPTVVYRPLELKGDSTGNRFHEGGFTLKYQLNANDFNPKNNYNFINGSELPIKALDGNHSTHSFDDRINVSVKHEKEENVSQIQVGIYGADLIHIELAGTISLIGKKGDLLFFSQKGLDNKVLLYDLVKKNIVWSKSMENLLISNDKLIFTEPVQAHQVSNKEEIDCKSGTGVQQTYYKVYALNYDVPNPIVEYTQQILCGYRENQSLAKL
ncbi:hypothetical protein [Flagellimonas flava]|nr:hypothetical protein [Allomuricauda flava]